MMKFFIFEAVVFGVASAMLFGLGLLVGILIERDRAKEEHYLTD